MTIARRQVVALGALGIGAAALDGCGGQLPWARHALSPDVERMLAELDEVVRQLKALDTHPEKFGIKPKAPHVAEGSTRCIEMLTTLCFLGTYRDVPETVWREPRVEKRLASTLPEIEATVTRACDRLNAITAEEGERIDELFIKEPDFAMRIMERIDDQAKQIKVPIEQRTYLRTTTMQLTSRFRYEGTKEVTSKLVNNFHRALRSRMSLLGIPQDSNMSDASGTEMPQSALWRARFRTPASSSEIQAATCKLATRAIFEGKERPVVVDFEGFQCPLPLPTQRADVEALPLHVAVALEPTEEGENVVVVVLYPPAAGASDEALSTAVTTIARDLQRRVAEAITPTAPIVTTPPPPPKLMQGQACQVNEECGEPLVCRDGVCDEEAGSAKLLRTTAKVAKWGAILLIPPICAVGVLVLTVALIMVIVAGFMYAGGN